MKSGELDFDALEQEETEFYAELGRCISVWAMVEISLLHLFHAAMFKGNFTLTAAAFYAIENFRSKLGAVDAALSVALKGQPVAEKWSGKGGLHQKLATAGKIRNRLAHFTVIHLGAIKKPPSVYLAPSPYKPGSDDFAPTRPTGGYYMADLKQIHKQFMDLHVEIMDFLEVCKQPIERFVKSLEREHRR